MLLRSHNFTLLTSMPFWQVLHLLLHSGQKILHYRTRVILQILTLLQSYNRSCLRIITGFECCLSSFFFFLDNPVSIEIAFLFTYILICLRPTFDFSFHLMTMMMIMSLFLEFITLKFAYVWSNARKSDLGWQCERPLSARGSVLDWYMYQVSDWVLFCKLFSDLPYVLIKSQHTNKRRPLQLIQKLHCQSVCSVTNCDGLKYLAPIFITHNN